MIDLTAIPVQSYSCPSSALLLIKGTIYKIRNSVTGKVYIGQTRTGVRKRWSTHKSEAQRGRDTPICRAIRKYGTDSFTLSVLATVSDPNDLNILEEMYVALHSSYNATYGYNATRGGNQFPLLPHVRERIAASYRGRKRTPEQIATMREIGKATSTPDRLQSLQQARERWMRTHPHPMAGRKHSAETRQKLRKSHLGQPSSRKGQKHTPEAIAKCRINAVRRSGADHWNYGKSVSCTHETRLLQSLTAKKRLQTPEGKAKHQQAAMKAWITRRENAAKTLPPIAES